MTRKFLIDLGIAKEIIDQIMEEYGHTVETIKDKIATKKEKEIEKMQTNIDKLEAIKTDLEDKTLNSEWEKKYIELDKKYNKDFEEKQKELEEKIKEIQTKENAINSFELEKGKQVKREILKQKLIEDNVPEKLVQLVELKFDLDKLEIEDKKIKNYDDIANPIKQEFPEVFTTIKEAGFIPNLPPNNNNNQGQVYTMQDIKAMTPEEINKNWDNGVTKTLEKGI